MKKLFITLCLSVAFSTSAQNFFQNIKNIQLKNTGNNPQLTLTDKSGNSVVIIYAPSPSENVVRTDAYLNTDISPKAFYKLMEKDLTSSLKAKDVVDITPPYQKYRFRKGSQFKIGSDAIYDNPKFVYGALRLVLDGIAQFIDLKNPVGKTFYIKASTQKVRRVGKIFFVTGLNQLTDYVRAQKIGPVANLVDESKRSTVNALDEIIAAFQDAGIWKTVQGRINDLSQNEIGASEYDKLMRYLAFAPANLERVPDAAELLVGDLEDFMKLSEAKRTDLLRHRGFGIALEKALELVKK